MASKYGDWTRGEEEALLNILGGVGVARQILRQEARVEIVEINFFRKIENFAIQIPALPRPTLAELQLRWDWIKKIESDFSPTEAVTMELGTVLRSEEDRVSDNEYEFRLGSDSYLGFQQGMWLVENQNKFPELLALRGKVYIDLPGLKVVNSDGNRSFPYLYADGSRWSLDWSLFEGGFDRDDRVARPCQ